DTCSKSEWTDGNAETLAGPLKLDALGMNLRDLQTLDVLALVHDVDRTGADAHRCEAIGGSTRPRDEHDRNFGCARARRSANHIGRCALCAGRTCRLLTSR